MSSNIVQAATFDATKVTFDQPKILDSGGKMVYLNYDSRPLQIQTARMNVPYGLNVFDKSGPVSYSVDLSFRGSEEDPKMGEFKTMMETLDELLIDAGVKNAAAWFKMPNASREVISAFYTRGVKYSTDREGKPKPYPPTLKVKLAKKNGVFETQFYDAQKRSYEGVTVEELLVKRAETTALLKCGGVWISGTKFGLTWKAVQMRMDALPEGIRGYAIQDEDDFQVQGRRGGSRPAPSGGGGASRSAPSHDEEDDVVAAVMPGRKAAAPAVVEEVEDEAEEEEEDDDVVEAPPPPRKTLASSVGGVKKVVKKAGAK
jgi:hypothetical protein